MSTNVKPPSPQTSLRISSRQKDIRQGKKPPAAFETRTERRQRSSSLGGLISRILPSRRPERGHTLRSEFENLLPDPHKISSLTRTTAQNSVGVSNTKHDNGYTCGSKKEQAIPRKGHNLRKMLGVMETSTESKIISAQPFEEEKLQKNTIAGEALQDSNPITPPILTHGQCDEGILNTVSELNQISFIAQDFSKRKAQREQRRSLLESGDFLGVQGANPRTGYWDLSEETASSDPSQFSEETRRKIDGQAHMASELGRRYQQAQDLYHRELAQAKTLRSKKKIENLQQKQLDLELKQRRNGKWRLSEYGWNSVPEPDFSPVMRPTVETPNIKLAPGDRLFPMPCATDPMPYSNAQHVKQNKNLGQHAFLSVTDNIHQHQVSKEMSLHPQQDIKQRKLVGLPIHSGDNKSSDTIIHTNHSVNVATAQNGGLSLQQGHHSYLSTNSELLETTEAAQQQGLNDDSQNSQSFLGIRALCLGLEGLIEREATAILYQLPSMRQVLIRAQLEQNREGSTPKTSILSPRKLPPLPLRNPLPAKISRSSQFQREIFLMWGPPTMVKPALDLPALSINTSITTITGQDPPQHKSRRVPLHGVHPQSKFQNKRSSVRYQTHQPDIVISSERHLSPMKLRIAKLCQRAFSEKRKDVRSIHMSISTSQQSCGKRKDAARSAAQLAYQRLGYELSMKKANGQHEKSPNLPKRTYMNGDYVGLDSKKDTPNIQKGSKRGKLIIMASGEKIRSKGGISVPSKKREANLFNFWHPASSLHKLQSHLSHKSPRRSKNWPFSERKSQRAHSPTRGYSIWNINNVWLFLDFAFNPNTGVRMRFKQRRATWQDTTTFFAAGFSMVGVLLVAIASAKVLGIAVSLPEKCRMLLSGID